MQWLSLKLWAPLFCKKCITSLNCTSATGRIADLRTSRRNTWMHVLLKFVESSFPRKKGKGENVCDTENPVVIGTIFKKYNIAF